MVVPIPTSPAVVIIAFDDPLAPVRKFISFVPSALKFILLAVPEIIPLSPPDCVRSISGAAVLMCSDVLGLAVPIPTNPVFDTVNSVLVAVAVDEAIAKSVRCMSVARG